MTLESALQPWKGVIITWKSQSPAHLRTTHCSTSLVPQTLFSGVALIRRIGSGRGVRHLRFLTWFGINLKFYLIPRFLVVSQKIPRHSYTMFYGILLIIWITILDLVPRDSCDSKSPYKIITDSYSRWRDSESCRTPRVWGTRLTRDYCSTTIIIRRKCSYKQGIRNFSSSNMSGKYLVKIFSPNNYLVIW